MSVQGLEAGTDRWRPAGLSIRQLLAGGLAVAGLSLLIGYVLSLDPDWLHVDFDPTRTRHVVGLVAGMAVVVAIFRWPEVGALGLLAIIFTNASEVGLRFHGLPSALQLFVPLVAMVLVGRWLLSRERKLLIDPILVWLVLYGVVILASSTNADAPENADAALFELAKIFLIVFLLINLITTRRVFRNSVWVLVLCGAFLGTISVYQVVSGSYGSEFGGFGRIKYAHIAGSSFGARLAGPLSDPNFYAQSLAVLVPLALYRLRDETSIQLKAIAAYALVMVVVTVVFTYSRAAAVTVALVLGLAVLHMRVNLKHAAIGAVVLAGLVVLLPEQFGGRLTTLEQLLPEGGDAALKLDSSFEQRKLYMLTAWEMFTDRPVLGVGAGNYAEDYHDYSGRVGAIVSSYEDFGRPRFPHSLYLEIGAETGLAGLTVFAGIIASTLWSFGTAYGRFKRAGDRPSANMVVGLALGFVGYLLTSLFLHGDYIRYFWVLVALAAVAKRVADQRQSARHQPGAAVETRRSGVET